MPHVFLSYMRDDIELVDQLVAQLKRGGVKVWLDREQINPGERWQFAIANALKNGAFFVACFSGAYEQRIRSYAHEELTLAIKELNCRPTHRTWFIPVLLTQCNVPDRAIGAGETLHDIQWVDLTKDWDRGVRMLIDVLNPLKESQSTATPLVLHSAKVNIYKLLNEAKDSLSGISAGIEIDIQRDSDDLQVYYTYGDRDVLLYCFKEILLNSIKALHDSSYLYQATGKIFLDILSAKTNANIVIHFRDNAPGIAQKDQKLIFQSEFRVARGGTGLGLYPVKRSIESHSGTFTLGNDQEGGHFIVVLPKINENG